MHGLAVKRKTFNFIFTYCRDEFESLGFGVHVLGFPLGNKTHVWQAMVWLRQFSGVQEYWFTLTENPAQKEGKNKIFIDEDGIRTHAGRAQWISSPSP